MSSNPKLEILMKPGGLAPSHGGPMQYVTWSVCLNDVAIASSLDRQRLDADLQRLPPPSEIQQVYDLLELALSPRP